MRESFSFSFTIQPPPKVVEATPTGKDLPLDSVVRVVFDREVDPSSVESSFKIEPLIRGSFEWKDEKTFVWIPNGLDFAMVYKVSLAGKSPEGDPMVPYTFEFRTKESPPPPSLIVEARPISANPIRPVSRVGGGNKIILTFDDCGYPPGGTVQILNILAQYGAKAIFFPTGACVQQYPDIFDRLIAEGHLIGNHTYNHPNLTALPLEKARWQIANGPPQAGGGYWRPPYGAHNRAGDQIATELGYTLMMWDIDTRDWARRYSGGDQEILNIVLSQAFPGAVVLMHVHVPNTLKVLPTMIEQLQTRGYIISW